MHKPYALCKTGDGMDKIAVAVYVKIMALVVSHFLIKLRPNNIIASVTAFYVKSSETVGEEWYKLSCKEKDTFKEIAYNIKNKNRPSLAMFVSMYLLYVTTVGSLDKFEEMNLAAECFVDAVMKAVEADKKKALLEQGESSGAY